MLEERTMRNFMIFACAAILLFVGCSKENVSPSSDGPDGSGEGGSMAAMTIAGNYLYRIADGTTIEVYDISKDSTAILVNSIAAGSGIETVFPYKNYLLFGTQGGMLIYDISTPSTPTYVSTYFHVVSCDPVVAQGKYAYVTLRNGNRCNRGLTQLEVIDISDISNPQLITSINMLMPHGLDADGNNLVVGEGVYGFKTFDITDPENPVQKDFETKVPGYDVISQGSRFILVGSKGIYQYQYGSPKPVLLSTIPVNAP
jgi:hypothetical protein